MQNHDNGNISLRKHDRHFNYSLELVNRELFDKVLAVAKRMSKEDLIAFYKKTKAVNADFSTWSKEELLDVIDEIAERDARTLLVS
jgi:hypothetical protein